MSYLVRIQSWLRASFLRSSMEQSMAAEIRFHIEERTAHLIREGVSPEEARRISGAEFGSVDASKEKCREALGLRVWDDARADARHAVRQMWRSPGVTAVIVLSVALGIGANSALFSVFDAKVFRKLPVRNPDQLVLFQWDSQKWGPHDFTGTTPSEGSREGESWKTSTYFNSRSLEAFRGAPTLSDVVARTFARTMNVIIDGSADRFRVQGVSSNYFTVLGVPMLLGRGLVPEDDLLSATPATVISHDFWKRRFASDPAIIGRKIAIGDVPLTIVGVTPPEFRGSLTVAGLSPEFSIPLPFFARVTGRPISRDTWWLQLIGRMKPDVGVGQVRGSVEGMFRSIAADAAADSPKDIPRLEVYSASHGFTDIGSNTDITSTMISVSVVFGLLLLIVCLNVANLMLARAAARQYEIGIRLGLGAGRGRLIRQLLTESLLLSLFGTGVGLTFVWWGKTLLNYFLGSDGNLVQIDAHVLGFAGIVGLLSTFAFGLAPAFQATRTDISSTVRGQDGHLIGPRSALGKSLLVLQVAVSVPLLVGAGLLLRTVANVPSLTVGFDQENVLLFSAPTHDLRYNDAKTTALYEQMIERIDAIPGVLAATASAGPLASNSYTKQDIQLSEDDNRITDRTIRLLTVRPNFFDVMGIAVVRGRRLMSTDPAMTAKSGTPAPVVINERLARLYFAGKDTLGQHFRMQSPSNARVGTNVEVVGIAKDVTAGSVRDSGPTVFAVDPTVSGFEVRTAGNPLSVVPAIRDAVAFLDPKVPLLDIKTQREQILDGFSDTSSISLACGMFGGVALLLTSIGLYGLLSYNVARRTAEIGLRMALGARRMAVLRLVLGQTLVLILAGLSLGLGLSVAFMKSIRSLIFGVSLLDPLVIVSVIAILMLVTGVAGYLPARRASKVDPTVALRHS